MSTQESGTLVLGAEVRGSAAKIKEFHQPAQGTLNGESDECKWLSANSPEAHERRPSYIKEKDFFMATPEKALLDAFYLMS